jgi:hypothetical protein
MMLGMVRDCHGFAQGALTLPKPDRAAAKRYMQLAVKAGRGAAPYLRDWDLRQRIVSDQPMSEKEWARFLAQQDFSRFDTL